ncbi:hypothetical protein [Vibrio quintilis]|nr:hypothetical protein [Vibrio quintilis]
MLQQSAQMADRSSRELNQAHMQDYPKVEQAKPELPPMEAFPNTNKQSALYSAPAPDKINAIHELNQSNQYARIGTNMIQRDQDMIGSLLDVRV